MDSAPPVPPPPSAAPPRRDGDADRADRFRAELLAAIPTLEIIVGRALSSAEDARDSVQEVLARALRAIDQGVDIRGPVAAFVRGIATHVIADIHRARDRAPAADDADPDALPSPDPSALELLTDEEDRHLYREAIAQLDRRDQELMRRCFEDGASVADIARAWGEPMARLRKRKSRALQRIREYVERARAGRHAPGKSPTT